MKFRAMCVLVFVLAAVRGEGAVLLLTFQSDPQDYIGGGQNRTFTYDTLFGSQVFATIFQQSSGGPTLIRFLARSARELPNDSTGIFFFGTNQLGQPLAPGEYLGAELALAATAGHPGLDISLQSKACNRVTGSFTIEEATFNMANSEVLTFSASFEQHCEGAAAALRGTIHYELNPVPEPGAGGMVGMTVMVAGRRKRKLQTSNIKEAPSTRIQAPKKHQTPSTKG
jgi:hypothetical protein